MLKAKVLIFSYLKYKVCQTKGQVQQSDRIENPPEAFQSLIIEKKYQNVMFRLYDGLPLRFKADAIINAKDNPYQIDNHSIIESLSKEVIDTIREKEPLMQGEASYTKSGLADIQHIIHCCLPQWQGGQDGGRNELYYCIQAYYNSFKLADELQVKRLIFTDQNYSIQQIPKNLSAEAFVKGALKFINEHQNATLEEVIIVNKNKISINAMKNQINGQLSVDMNEELKQMIMHKESAFLDNTERSIRQNTLNRTDTLSNVENNNLSLVKQSSGKQILSQEITQDQGNQ